MAHKSTHKTSTANLGFEQKLWLAADKLRKNMDAAESERSGDSQPRAARRVSKARQYKEAVLANPPFNDSDWFRKDDDLRWQFGVPPKGNTNFAWVQHFIHHLAPQGMAGFVLANGSMPPTNPAEARSANSLSKPTSCSAWSPSRAISSAARRSQSAAGSWQQAKPPTLLSKTNWCSPH
jgi:type I restriction-modification system DNA methylase subunit